MPFFIKHAGISVLKGNKNFMDFFYKVCCNFCFEEIENKRFLFLEVSFLAID